MVDSDLFFTFLHVSSEENSSSAALAKSHLAPSVIPPQTKPFILVTAILSVNSLCDCSSLKNVSLGSNEIGPSAGNMLAAALEGSRTKLHMLNLEDCCLGIETTKKIQVECLTTRHTRSFNILCRMHVLSNLFGI